LPFFFVLMPYGRSFLAAALAAGVLLSGCLGNGPSDGARDGVSVDSVYETDVPYVATPQEVVRRMLQLADVTERDTVYDLGSGDGRILLTAAQQFGASGVGVEIVPSLVERARSHATLAGVDDRVVFRRQDLFKTDLHDATVVTLYLLPEVNRKLQPKLLRQLDPGDRVVAHNYGIGNWAPDTTVEMGDHTVFLWQVPESVPDSLLSPPPPPDSASTDSS
jgi:SAM-dependent methyltransferase